MLTPSNWTHLNTWKYLKSSYICVLVSSNTQLNKISTTMYCSISKSLFIIKTSLFKIYKGAYLTVYSGSFGSLYSFSHMECFWDCVWMCLPGICPAFITSYSLRIWDYFCIYILQSFCCSFCCCVIAGDDCYHFQILRTDIPRVPEFNSRNSLHYNNSKFVSGNFCPGK